MPYLSAYGDPPWNDREKVTFNGVEIDLEDVRQFLTQSSNPDAPCYACGANIWELLLSPKDGLVGQIEVSSPDDIGQKNGGIPLAFAACRRCGHMRPHALGVVVMWKKERDVSNE